MADAYDDRPLILVSNDDGYRASGNVALREALGRLGRVVTVAPEHEQSANSHAISLARPLRHRVIADDLHAVDGTPVDCVYVALFHGGLLPRKPDLVVSGINHGPNLGSDVHYSGTVAAAREAAMRGIPAIAFSLMSGGDLRVASELAVDICARVLDCEKPAGAPVLLNVNFPETAPRGLRATRLGKRHYAEGVDVRDDPRGREYFWIGGPGGVRHEPMEGSDTEAVDDGCVSITPLSIETTLPDHLGIAAFAAGPQDES